MMSEHQALSIFMNDPTLNKKQKTSKHDCIVMCGSFIGAILIAALKNVLGSIKFSEITVNLFGEP